MYTADDVPVGHFGYWNADWSPCHPRQSKPRCGTYLMLTTEGIERLANYEQRRLFYLWHCRKLTHSGSHTPFVLENFYGMVSASSMTGSE